MNPAFQDSEVWSFDRKCFMHPFSGKLSFTALGMNSHRPLWGIHTWTMARVELSNSDMNASVQYRSYHLLLHRW